MKITDLRATTVTMPLEAPLRHSNGAHWGRFVRTIVEIETDEGLTGLGEMGGGGESAEVAITGLKPYLLGHDPLQLEQLRWKIMNPVASLYNNRTPAPRRARIRLHGRRRQIPRHPRLRPDRRRGARGGAVRELPLLPLSRPEDRRRRRDDARRDGRPRPRPRRPLRLQEPQAEMRPLSARPRRRGVSRARRGLPRGRPPPRPEQRLERRGRRSASARRSSDLNNDYFEDPTWGLEGMRRVCGSSVDIPTATNTVVVNFEQLAACIRTRGDRRRSCSTPPSGAASARPTRPGRCSRRSSGARASIPPASSASSSPRCSTSARRCPISASPPTPTTTISPTTSSRAARCSTATARSPCRRDPASASSSTATSSREYAELYKELGGYPYDRDPGRPDWYTVMPERNYADPGPGRPARDSAPAATS